MKFNGNLYHFKFGIEVKYQCLNMLNKNNCFHSTLLTHTAFS